MQTAYSPAAWLRRLWLLTAAILLLPQLRAIVDHDQNQKSDIWQLRFDTGNLAGCFRQRTRSRQPALGLMRLVPGFRSRAFRALAQLRACQRFGCRAKIAAFLGPRA